MPMAAFDTMSVAKRLKDEFGMPQQQAEGVAVVLHENFVGNVATKEDVKGLKNDAKALDDKIGALDEKIGALDEKIQTVREHVTRLDGKIDISVKALDGKIDTVAATLKAEIAQSTNRAIYTLGGLVGILFVIDRIIPLFGVGN